MQSWQLGSEFEDIGIIDEEDIGWENRLKMGWSKNIDYYNQITRERACIAFIECYVPYKPKYELSEFSEIILTTLQKVKKMWDRSLPGGNMSTDITYWINLMKYYMGIEFNGETIDFSNTPWTKIYNDITFSVTPKRFLKDIYKANIVNNWKKMNEEQITKEILSKYQKRLAPSKNKKDEYTDSSHLKLGIRLAELFNENEIKNELEEFLTYVTEHEYLVINYIRREIYKANKNLDFSRLSYHNDEYVNNVYSQQIDMYLKVYDMIVNKNMHY
jgi:hypothetical protein